MTEPRGGAAKIANDLRKRIVSGRLSPEEKLPTYAQLAQDAGVDPNTAARAVGILRAEGLVYTLQGKGSFVAGRDDGAVEAGTTDEAVRRLTDKVAELEARVTSLENTQGRVEP